MLAINKDKKVKQFDQFPIDSIVDNSKTDFDTFLELDNHWILYSNVGYLWQREELTNLLKSGYEFFYVRKTDQSRIDMYQKLSEIPSIEKNQAPKERIVTLEQVGTHFVKCLHEGEITPASVEKAKELSGSIVDCMMEYHQSIQFLSGLGDFDMYTYYHSTRVSAYSVAIAIEMGLTDRQKLIDIGVGGLFHDIGKQKIDLNVLNKKGPLNEFEWQQMRAHPSQGYELIDEVIQNHICREIILHHHEKINGGGYPHGLQSHAILTEVQIATIADIFDALTSSRSYQQKRSRYQALDFLKHKLVGKDISADCYKALVSALARNP